MFGRRWWLLLGAASIAACGGGRTGPNMVTVDALTGTELNVTASRQGDLAGVSVLLDFAQLGEKLGDACPVVTATATVNGVTIEQQLAGGPNPCDDPPYCESEGKCLVPSWQGSFPAGFPASADGMVTIQLVDAGTPATMVSGLDVRADVTLSAVTEPTAPDGSPQATLTVVPQPPYSVIATSEATETDEPLLTMLFTTSAGDADVQTTPAGAPNTFQIAFPPATDLARPATGQLTPYFFFGPSPAKPPTTVCTGVDGCTATVWAEPAPLSVTLP